MKILVCNIGSTSFKHRLFEVDERGERVLASGSADRIGSSARGGGVLTLQVAGGRERSQQMDFADHGQAIRHVLAQLQADGVLASPGDLDAVAFKAVMGGDCEAVTLVDERVLERMEYFVPIAPAHNPAYIAAMRMFREVLGDTPLVAAFEPGFHRTIPDRRRYYAVPPEWASEYGVKRYGFHGASHRYIATRTAQLMPRARRVISCHLGGSSSICAISDGRSVATSMGLSAQSGLPQGSRAGDFDPFAIALLRAQTQMTTEQILEVLGGQSGLAALSGTSGDMRDIRAAARAGGKQAQLAIDVYVTAIRDYVGAYLAELGGADALVFTGGIGRHNPDLRAAVCGPLAFAGIRLDAQKNESASGECRIDSADASTAVWVMPTNEEIIVARQAMELLSNIKGENNQ